MNLVVDSVEPVLGSVVIVSYEGEYSEEEAPSAAPVALSSLPSSHPKSPTTPSTAVLLSPMPGSSSMSAASQDEFAASAAEEVNTGYFHGKGAAVLDNGCKYEGSFRFGLFHGKGKFSWPNGVSYSGDFEYGTMNGAGVYEWHDGSRYDGHIRDGYRHGRGRFNSSAGQMYDGEWENGKRHGAGRMTYNTERTVVYNGDWAENERHGYGTMKYSSGNTYEGEWQRDKKCGSGVMVWRDVDEVYTGQWENDKPHGLGEHVWGESGLRNVKRENCNIYRGAYVDGKRQGFGTYFYMNGSRYMGQWHEDQKQGEGIFFYADGRIHAGRFVDNRMEQRHGAGSEAVSPQFRFHIDDVFDRYPLLLQPTAKPAAETAARRSPQKTVSSGSASIPLPLALKSTINAQAAAAVASVKVFGAIIDSAGSSEGRLAEEEELRLKLQREEVAEIERLVLKYNDAIRAMLRRYTDMDLRDRLHNALQQSQRLSSWMAVGNAQRSFRACAAARLLPKRIFCLSIGTMLRFLRECGFVGPYFSAADLCRCVREMRAEHNRCAIQELRNARLRIRCDAKDRLVRMQAEYTQAQLQLDAFKLALAQQQAAQADHNSGGNTTRRTARGSTLSRTSSADEGSRAASPSSTRAASPPLPTSSAAGLTSLSIVRNGSDRPVSPQQQPLTERSARPPSSMRSKLVPAKVIQPPVLPALGDEAAAERKRLYKIATGAWPAIPQYDFNAELFPVDEVDEDATPLPPVDSDTLQDLQDYNALRIVQLWDEFLEPLAVHPEFDLHRDQPLHEHEIVELWVRAVAVWYSRCRGVPLSVAKSASHGNNKEEDVDVNERKVGEYGAPGMTLTQIVYFALAEKLLPASPPDTSAIPEFYLDMYHEEVQNLLRGRSEFAADEDRGVRFNIAEPGGVDGGTNTSADGQKVSFFHRLWRFMIASTSSSGSTFVRLPALLDRVDKPRKIAALPDMHRAAPITASFEAENYISVMGNALVCGEVQLRHVIMLLMSRRGQWVAEETTVTMLMQVLNFSPPLFSNSIADHGKESKEMIAAPEQASSEQDNVINENDAAPDSEIAPVEISPEETLPLLPPPPVPLDPTSLAKPVDFEDFLEMICRLILSPLWIFKKPSDQKEVSDGRSAEETGSRGLEEAKECGENKEEQQSEAEVLRNDGLESVGSDIDSMNSSPLGCDILIDRLQAFVEFAVIDPAAANAEDNPEAHGPDENDTAAA